jgi:hypothetical protein
MKFAANIYSVIKAASVLRVAGLKAWINISYATSFLRKGLDALKSVYLTLDSWKNIYYRTLRFQPGRYNF